MRIEASAGAGEIEASSSALGSGVEAQTLPPRSVFSSLRALAKRLNNSNAWFLVQKSLHRDPAFAFLSLRFSREPDDAN